MATSVVGLSLKVDVRLENGEIWPLVVEQGQALDLDRFARIWHRLGGAEMQLFWDDGEKVKF